MTQKNGKTLVDIKNLSKLFPVGQGVFGKADSFVHAVSDFNLQIKIGESVGLVGESGCGKTTTGKLITRLLDPTTGNIFMDTEEGSVDIALLKGKEMKVFRRRVQMIFQDPYESMNPRMTIFDTVAEPLNVQGIGNMNDRETRVADLLETVDLAPASSFLFRYPHELSGGQRQRVAIARALVINPDFVVADEPTSMLDVSVRTGVMNLMQDLADQFDVTYLYITHDLAVARYMCDRIGVMYLGKIVEIGETEDLLHNPQHPYTQALLSAVPVPDPALKSNERIILKGDVPSPIDPPPGCSFHPRCLFAKDICSKREPEFREIRNKHFVACFFAGQLELTE